MPDPKDKNMSDDFLKSLTELADSEEYGDVTKELIKEVSDDVDVSPFEIKGIGSRKAAEEDDLKALFLEVQDHAAEVEVDESEYEDYDELPEVKIEPAKPEKPEPPVKVPVNEILEEKETAKISEAVADTSEKLEEAETDFKVDVGDVFDTLEVDEPTDTEDVPAEPKIDLDKLSESIINESSESAPSLIEALRRKPEDKAKEPEKVPEKEAETKAEEKTDGAEKNDEKAPDGNGSDENASDKKTEENVTPESEEVPKKGKKKKKKKSLVYTLMMFACIGVFLYCVIRIGIYYYTQYEYKKGMNKLQDIVGDISKDVDEINPNTITVTDLDIYFPDEMVYVTETSTTKKIVDEVSDDWKKKYTSLYEMNHDCVGWIKIPDTQIDYPVMYTPGDYEKYLYKDFEGRYLFRGLPFMAEKTQLNKSQNYIIYGHNMNDGTAFNNLRKFRDNKWIEDGHKYCYFNTAYAEGVYEVMAVVITKIYTVEDKCFKYYKYDGELTEDEFNTYVYYMKKLSSYKSDVEAYWGDQLLSLSTCYRVYDPEGRLVVVFKRVQ
ncbi:MAG: sortase [Lachnospiraceae bacterium]|nr:sortase [Lachnospiraceae bacterium]